MSRKLFAILLLSLLAFTCRAEDDDDANEEADDPSSDWVGPGSSDDSINVKSTTNVQVLKTREVLPPARWNTVKVDQMLLVRNWPCRVSDVANDADAPAAVDAPAGDEDQEDVADDSTKVNVNVKVKAGVTKFNLGKTRCVVQPRRNLITRKSCTSSAHCHDSGTVCKTSRGAVLQDNLDYADPLEDVDDMEDVSEDPSQDPAFDPNADSDESDQSAASEGAADNSDPEADVESDDDDLKDFIDDAASTDDTVAVKNTVNVWSASSRRPVPPAVWPTLPIGENLLVGRRPCVVTQNDQADMEAQQSDSVSVHVSVSVTVNTQVTVGKVLALGPLRCKVRPAVIPNHPRPGPRPIIHKRGVCVCDSRKRHACRSIADCRKFGNLRCVATQACPIKGKRGYCRV